MFFVLRFPVYVFLMNSSIKKAVPSKDFLSLSKLPLNFNGFCAVSLVSFLGSLEIPNDVSLSSVTDSRLKLLHIFFEMNSFQPDVAVLFYFRVVEIVQPG